MAAAAAEHNQEVPFQTAFLAAPVAAALEMRALVIMVWARLEHQAKEIAAVMDFKLAPPIKAAAVVAQGPPERLVLRGKAALAAMVLRRQSAGRLLLTQAAAAAPAKTLEILALAELGAAARVLDRQVIQPQELPIRAVAAAGRA